MVSRPPPPADRQRRVHAKSRKGCGNCKLRRVKCDELRPWCKKCVSFGVDCNYDGGKQTPLEISAQGSFQVRFEPIEKLVQLDAPYRVDIAPSSFSHQNGMSATGIGLWPASLLTPFSPVSMTASLSTTIRNSLEMSVADMQPISDSAWTSPVSFWHFSESHLEILARFRDRTALTIGDKSLSAPYRDILCHLAMQNPFLMHMLLSLTLMHDAHIASAPSPSTAKQQKHTALQHWNTATKLFNNILARPIRPNQRDAIWATGVIIGAASFWYTHSTSDVEKVWPLKPTEPDDLGWLRLGEGKKALWRISEPKRPDSMFHDILKFKDSYGHAEPDWVRRPEAMRFIPAHVRQIFDITDTSTIENNVYLTPLLIISRLSNMRLSHANVISFLYVIAFVSPRFIALLEAKDARAVFVVGWWFKLMEDGDLWWMVSRAVIEGCAIRIWLEREDKRYGLANVLDGLIRDREPGLDGPDSLMFSVEVWAQRLEEET